MMRTSGLTPFLLSGFVLLGWMVHASPSSPVRRVTGIPEGHYVWALSGTETSIYAVDIYGNRYDLRYRPLPNQLETSNFVMRVDIQAERVVDTFVIHADFCPLDNGSFLDAWRKGTHPHLVSHYDYWVTDPSRAVVYALKPSTDATDARMTFERWRELYVLESHTGKVLRVVRMPEGYIECIRLSPDRRLLAVASGQQIRLYQAPDMQLLETLSFGWDAAIPRMVFSADGRRLFVFGKARGLLIADMERKRFDIGDDEALRGQPMTFGLPYLEMWDMALSPDEREVYIALAQLKWSKGNGRYVNGRVAAVDVGSRRVVRVLHLSDTGCFCLAVVGNKLFAACLDGIYVIEIEAWRKNPNYQPPWVKQGK